MNQMNSARAYFPSHKNTVFSFFFSLSLYIFIITVMETHVYNNI